MNYISEQIDFRLFQFGPLVVRIEEISCRRVVSELASAPFQWLLLPSSTLKRDLAEKNLLQPFGSLEDVQHPDLVGFNPEDKVIVVVATPDSHLFVAGCGFRFFLATFEKKKFSPSLFVDGREVPFHPAIE